MYNRLNYKMYEKDYFSIIVLSSTLSRDYRIEIISGNYCFWSFIYL